MNKDQYPIGFELIKTDMRRLIFAISFGFGSAFLLFDSIFNLLVENGVDLYVIALGFLLTAAFLGNRFKLLLNHIYQWNKKAYRTHRKHKKTY